MEDVDEVDEFLFYLEEHAIWVVEVLLENHGEL